MILDRESVWFGVGKDCLHSRIWSCRLFTSTNDLISDIQVYKIQYLNNKIYSLWFIVRLLYWIDEYIYIEFIIEYIYYWWIYCVYKNLMFFLKNFACQFLYHLNKSTTTWISGKCQWINCSTWNDVTWKFYRHTYTYIIISSSRPRLPYARGQANAATTMYVYMYECLYVGIYVCM